jgi:hypothetical protein
MLRELLNEQPNTYVQQQLLSHLKRKMELIESIEHMPHLEIKKILKNL